MSIMVRKMVTLMFSIHQNEWVSTDDIVPQGHVPRLDKSPGLITSQSKSFSNLRTMLFFFNMLNDPNTLFSTTCIEANKFH